MIRFTLFTVIVVAIVGLGLFITASSRQRVDQFPMTGFTTVVSAPGFVEGATPDVELRARLDGRVVRLSVREGQLVEAGDELLRIDDQQYEHELALAKAELALAEAELTKLKNGAREEQRREARDMYNAKLAQLEQAELAFRRVSQLLGDSATSQREFDDARTQVAALRAELSAAKARADLIHAPPRADELQIAESRVAAAQARVRLAETQLERTRLRAPTAGQILKVHVEPGELIGPGAVEPAIVFVDSSVRRVRAFVEEMDAPRIKLGMPVVVTADGMPGQQFQGQVSQLSPRMAHKSLWTSKPAERYDTLTREILIDLKNAPDLVVGLRVDVQISGEEAPESASSSETSESHKQDL